MFGIEHGARTVKDRDQGKDISLFYCPTQSKLPAWLDLRSSRLAVYAWTDEDPLAKAPCSEGPGQERESLECQDLELEDPERGRELRELEVQDLEDEQGQGQGRDRGREVSARERRSLLAVAVAELALGFALFGVLGCPSSESKTSTSSESGTEDDGGDEFEDPIRFDVLEIPDSPETPLPEPPT